MSGIVYYIPKRGGMSMDAVKKLGLDYAADDQGPGCVSTPKGPDGAGGLYFGWGMDNLANVAAAASYEQIDGGEVWVGIDEANRPTPDILARSDQLPGEVVRLADDNDYLIPHYRLFPRTMKLTDGKWGQGEVISRYHAFYSEAEDAWGAFIGAPEEDSTDVATFETETDVAINGLALNYRISAAEVSRLGLFDTTSQGKVMLALFDWAAVKKKATEAGSMPGDADE